MSCKEGSSAYGIQIGRYSRGVPEVPLIKFRSFKFATQEGVCDDFPFLWSVYLKSETAFEVGLVETGHQQMSVMAFELSVQILVVVLGVNIGMQSHTLV